MSKEQLFYRDLELHQFCLFPNAFFYFTEETAKALRLTTVAAPLEAQCCAEVYMLLNWHICLQAKQVRNCLSFLNRNNLTTLFTNAKMIWKAIKINWNVLFLKICSRQFLIPWSHVKPSFKMGTLKTPFSLLVDTGAVETCSSTPWKRPFTAVTKKMAIAILVANNTL